LVTFTINIHIDQVLFVPSSESLRKWLASAEILGAMVQPSLRLSCADVPEREKKPKPFGWDALINTQSGFGFQVEEDEDKMPGPKAQQVQNGGSAAASSGTARLMRVIGHELGKRFLSVSDSEKACREQDRLKKHEQLRYLFEHPYYDICSTAWVSLGVFLTSLDPEHAEALLPQSEIEKNLVEGVFMILFACEFFGKGIALGFWGPASLGSWWGWIDLGVLVSMIITFVEKTTEYSGVSALPMRSVRVLRILRTCALIPRMKRLRNSLQSLWTAKYSIYLVVCLIFMLALTATAVGLELFSGRMVYCTSLNDVYKKECMGTYLTAALDEDLGVLAWSHAKEHVPEAAEGLILAPRSWHKSTVNFDDFSNIMNVVLIIALPSSTGWAKIAEDAIRVQGQGDMAMHPTGTDFQSVIIVGWCILLLHMVLYNLLVAVFIKNLRENSGLASMTSVQRAWATSCRVVESSASYIKGSASSHPGAAQGNRGSNLLKRVVEARAFACTFDLLIFLNFILLCLPSAD